MKKRIALGAGVLALVWTSFLYTNVMPDESSNSPATPDAAEPPAAESVLTKRDPTDVPRLPAAPAQRAPKPGHESPAVAPPLPLPASGDFDEMQRSFESEGRDVAWASEEEASIPPLLAEVGFPEDALDGEVSCRRTLCRFPLRVVENDAFALLKLADKVQQGAKLGLAYGASEVVGDKTRIVVYLSPPRAPAETAQ
jgi:hypothetical protein